MRRAVERTLVRLACPRLALDVHAVDPATMAALNARHRGRRGPTDVLTFPAPDADGAIGDVVLCLPAVRRRAVALRRPWRRWLEVLAVHGTLHALGFHHGDTEAAGLMFSIQQACARNPR